MAAGDGTDPPAWDLLSAQGRAQAVGDQPNTTLREKSSKKWHPRAGVLMSMCLWVLQDKVQLLHPWPCRRGVNHSLFRDNTRPASKYMNLSGAGPK